MLGLAEALGCLPQRLSLYLISGRRFGNDEISAEVAAGARPAARGVLRDLASDAEATPHA